MVEYTVSKIFQKEEDKLKKIKIKEIVLPNTYTEVNQKELDMNGEIGIVAIIFHILAAGCALLQ